MPPIMKSIDNTIVYGHLYHKELYLYRINKDKIIYNTLQKTLDKIKLKNTLKPFIKGFKSQI